MGFGLNMPYLNIKLRCPDGRGAPEPTRAFTRATLGPAARADARYRSAAPSRWPRFSAACATRSKPPVASPAGIFGPWLATGAPQIPNCGPGRSACTIHLEVSNAASASLRSQHRHTGGGAARHALVLRLFSDAPAFQPAAHCLPKMPGEWPRSAFRGGPVSGLPPGFMARRAASAAGRFGPSPAGPARGIAGRRRLRSALESGPQFPDAPYGHVPGSGAALGAMAVPGRHALWTGPVFHGARRSTLWRRRKRRGRRVLAPFQQSASEPPCRPHPEGMPVIEIPLPAGTIGRTACGTAGGRAATLALPDKAWRLRQNPGPYLAERRLIFRRRPARISIPYIPKICASASGAILDGHRQPGGAPDSQSSMRGWHSRALCAAESVPIP